jgi:NTP pyrophosphatase (non-canonical NTP hydrolase)
MVEKDESNLSEESFDDSDRKANVDLDNPLNINECEEKATSKKLKGKISRDILPELKAIEDSNSKITVELDEIMNSILNNDNAYANLSEKTIDVIADMLIHHALIEENIDDIKNKTKKL